MAENSPSESTSKSIHYPTDRYFMYLQFLFSLSLGILLRGATQNGFCERRISKRDRRMKKMTSAGKNKRAKQSVSCYVKYKIGWSSSAKVPHGSCVNVRTEEAETPFVSPTHDPSSYAKPLHGSSRMDRITTAMSSLGGRHSDSDLLIPFFFPVMIYGFINATYNALSWLRDEKMLINRFISRTKTNIRLLHSTCYSFLAIK